MARERVWQTSPSPWVDATDSAPGFANLAVSPGIPGSHTRALAAILPVVGGGIRVLDRFCRAVIAVPDLDEAVRCFTDLGCIVAPGGP